MAEERTLGLVRAPESTEDLSKEELQRRMDVARDSISNTVTEIKETVANQVQAVKDTLDWREQFKRRPVAWSVGAFGVGFLLGYRMAAMVGEDDEPSRDFDYYGAEYRSYAGQPILNQPGASMKHHAIQPTKGENGHDEEKGPGLFERLTQTPAYHRVRDEVGDIGNNLVQELTKTAKVTVIPALMTSLKNFLGQYLPEKEKTGERSGQSPYARSEAEPSRRQQGSASSYQPSLERNQS